MQPLDNFSYLTSALADSAFFGAGLYEGFGFSWKRLAGDEIRLTRVFTGSPAEAAGFSRGQRIVALDGRSIAEIEADLERMAAQALLVMGGMTEMIARGMELSVMCSEDYPYIDTAADHRDIRAVFSQAAPRGPGAADRRSDPSRRAPAGVWHPG